MLPDFSASWSVVVDMAMECTSSAVDASSYDGERWELRVRRERRKVGKRDRVNGRAEVSARDQHADEPIVGTVPINGLSWVPCTHDMITMGISTFARYHKILGRYVGDKGRQRRYNTIAQIPTYTER